MQQYGTFYYQFPNGACVDLDYNKLCSVWAREHRGTIAWNGKAEGVLFETSNKDALEKIFRFIVKEIMTTANIDSLVDKEKRIQVVIPENLLLGVSVRHYQRLG